MLVKVNSEELAGCFPNAQKIEGGMFPLYAVSRRGVYFCPPEDWCEDPRNNLSLVRIVALCPNWNFGCRIYSSRPVACQRFEFGSANCLQLAKEAMSLLDTEKAAHR